MMRMMGRAQPASSRTFARSSPAHMLMSRGFLSASMGFRGVSTSAAIWGFTARKMRSQSRATLTVSV